MNEISERYILLINELIERKLITNSKEFALQIGISVSSITEIGKGRTNVGLSLIQKTVLHYPLISLEWLICGNGFMFKDEDPKLNIQNINREIINNNDSLLIKYLKEKDVKIEKLIRERTELIIELELYKKSLAQMDGNEHVSMQR